MSIQEIEDVLTELPDEQLDDLIDRLTLRRGMSPEAEQDWLGEARRRLAEYDAGGAEGIPMSETLAKLRATLR